MTGIVLAGGESRRMGTNKAFLALDGAPLIEHVLRVMRKVFPRIILVTNTPAAYASYPVDVVTDALKTPGPLTGIYSGLLASSDEHNFVVACDMPFLNAGLLSYMAGVAKPYDIVAPCIGGLLEPLHAIYSKKLLPVIENRLQMNKQRIRAIYEGASVRYVTEIEIDRFDPGRRSFINLNTPHEFEEATCSDLECRNLS
jgi:molybdopterin-guanine dinucleotide biosynthesis protein A